MFGYIPEFRDYYLKLLELTNEYKPQPEGDIATFNYQHDSDVNLQKLREKYDLEEIAGAGSEIDQILKLTSWVHKKLTHGSMSHHEINDALYILRSSRSRKPDCELLCNCHCFK